MRKMLYKMSLRGVTITGTIRVSMPDQYLAFKENEKAISRVCFIRASWQRELNPSTITQLELFENSTRSSSSNEKLESKLLDSA